MRGLRARRGRAGHRRARRATTVPVRGGRARWARWACSGCRSPRSTAAWAATTSRCAWRSRSSARVDSVRRDHAGGRRGLGAMPIYRFGTDAQKQEWLPRLCQRRGARRVRADRARAAAATPARTRTTARLDGDEWVINGTKAVHHQLRHRHHRAASRSPRSPVTSADGRQGDLGDPGAQRARRASPSQPAYYKVGWNASDTHPLTFDDVRVPEENLLGERGRGYAQFLRSSTRGGSPSPRWRPGGAGLRRRVGASTPRSGRRSAGRSGATRRSQFKIADMEVRAHTARLAWHDAAARMLAGKPFKTAGGDRQAGRLARRRWTTPATPPRSSAATGS